MSRANPGVEFYEALTDAAAHGAERLADHLGNLLDRRSLFAAAALVEALK